jgi:hypothetical protein
VSVKVVGLKETRAALRRAGDERLVNRGFAGASRAAAQVAVSRIRVEAALTGRREIIRAVETVVPGTAYAKATIRAGSTAKSRSWSLAALFGTHHDLPRISPNGRSFTGHNQFVPVQRDGGPLYRGINKSLDDIGEAYADAIEDLYGN